MITKDLEDSKLGIHDAVTYCMKTLTNGIYVSVGKYTYFVPVGCDAFVTYCIVRGVRRVY